MDYTSLFTSVIKETESGAGGLTYRFVYHDALRKNHAVIYGIPTGVGAVVQYIFDDGSGALTIATDLPGGIAGERVVTLGSVHAKFALTSQ